MDNREMEKKDLELEDMDQIAGGRALPESIIKRFTRQEKEKGTDPKRFTAVSQTSVPTVTWAVRLCIKEM